ncbi:hypothetical protein SAMN02745243_02396 [Hespellia stercorisuis DSM 15480]|uniref:Uncharacterized protein n=1 Tax=Hespellia stercorisuis DSM 15480 TaxID=1121950 RepID=A0A1M6QD63_9FIRM|nr:hypothetical protein SAMN02745243_02396 [Hespellia stercorisuis DSM 15480]
MIVGTVSLSSSVHRLVHDTFDEGGDAYLKLLCGDKFLFGPAAQKSWPGGFDSKNSETVFQNEVYDVRLLDKDIRRY